MTDPLVKLTEFGDLIDSYTAGFVGRQWLIEQVDSLLADPQCRFVILTGGPGVGKSAFMAHLADANPHWLRYFIRRDSRQLLRPSDGKTFFLTIGGQLATLRPELFASKEMAVLVQQHITDLEAAGELVGARVEELKASPFYSVAIQVEQEVQRVKGKATGVEIGRLVVESRLLTLQDLQFLGLLDPAWLLYQTDPHAKIMVLVDALDELRFSPAEIDIVDALCRIAIDLNASEVQHPAVPGAQTPTIPPNLRFILTSRREKFLDRLLSRPDVRELPLNIGSVDNRFDLQQYTLEHLPETELVSALAQAHKTRDRFVIDLLDRANGNFLYLRSVLSAIQEALTDSGKAERLQPLLRVEELPADLDTLYDYFLHAIVDWVQRRGFGDAAWRTYLRPLLGILAVAREPLSHAQLLRFTHIAPEDLGDLLRELRQFVEPAINEHTFHIYHTSFAEYLLDATCNRDYQIDASKWHKHIADYYWQHQHDRWSNCDEYGLNNLAMHLLLSGQADKLVALISPQWLQARYTRSGFTYIGFNSDVDIAWRAVLGSSVNILQLFHLQTAHFVVQEHVQVYENTDLRILVGLGRMDEALAHVRLLLTPTEQFRGFLTIYRAAIEWLGEAAITSASDVVNAAHKAANAIGDVGEKVRSLCWLATALAQTHAPDYTILLDEAQQSIADIQSEDSRASAERNLVEALVQVGKLQDVQQIALNIANEAQRAWALAELAKGLATSGQFNKASSVARMIQSDWVMYRDSIQRIRVKALADVASSLASASDERAMKLFHEAEQVASAIATKEGYKRAEALRDLVMALVTCGYLIEAQRVATSIQSGWKAFALNDVVEAYAKAEQFEQARSVVSLIDDDEWQSLAWGTIATRLAEAGRYDDARAIVHSVQDLADRAHKIMNLAAALAEQGDRRAESMLAEAGRLSEQIKNNSERVEVLRHLVLVLLQTNDVQQASVVFEQVQHEASMKRNLNEYSSALREIAVALARVADARADLLFDEAATMIEQISGFDKENARRDLAAALIRTGRLDRAWQVLETNQHDLLRDAVWCELALSLVYAGDDRAQAAFEQALQAAWVKNDTARDETLARVVTALVEARWFNNAENVIALIRDDCNRSKARCDLAISLHTVDLDRAREVFAHAEQEAWQEWADYSRDKALVKIVCGLAETRQFDDARRIVATIENDTFRVEALCCLCAFLARAGNSDGFTLLEEGLRIASSERGNTWYEGKELRREAAWLTRSGDARANELWAQAQAITGSLWVGWFWNDPQSRAEALTHLAVALAQIPDRRAGPIFDTAHRTALEIPYEQARDTTLGKILTGLVDSGRFEHAERVAKDIHHEMKRQSAVQNLVKSCLKAQHVNQALHAARSISSAYYRRDILREVAAGYAQSGKIVQALQVLEESKLDEYLQAVGITLAAWTAGQREMLVDAVVAATAVAGWRRSDWKAIGDKLSVS